MTPGAVPFAAAVGAVVGLACALTAALVWMVRVLPSPDRSLRARVFAGLAPAAVVLLFSVAISAAAALTLFVDVAAVCARLIAFWLAPS